MFDERHDHFSAPESAPDGLTPSAPPAAEPQSAPVAPATLPLSRYAEAGRKGAHRVHLLIERGKLYEEEHGLKGGRQRLRQLIEQGKLYEEEHGLRPRRKRRRRSSPEAVVQGFLQSLLRVMKPKLRARLLQMVADLEREEGRAAQE